MAPPALVSIISPCFNHEHFVEETLRSLVAQTYPRVELVLINDGSSDRSEEVIRAMAPELERRFERFVFVSKKNEGICSALNQGINLASGEYVFLFATDDVAHPEAIEQLVSRIETDGPKCALVCAEADFIDAEGARIYPREDGTFSQAPIPGVPGSFTAYHLRERRGFDWVEDFGSYRSILQGNYLPIGLLIRRAALLDVGLYDPLVRPDDWQMWFKLAQRYRMAFVPRELAHYRRHGGNVTLRTKATLDLDSFRLLASQYEYCHTHGLTRDWYRTIASWLSLRNPRAAQRLLEGISVEPLPLARGLLEAKLRSLKVQVRRAVRDRWHRTFLATKSVQT